MVCSYKDELILLIIILLAVGIYNFIKHEINKINESKKEKSIIIRETFHLENINNKKDEYYIRDYDKLLKTVEYKIKENQEKEYKKLIKKGKKIQEEYRKQKGSKNGNDKTLVADITYYTAFCPTGCIGITKTGHDVKNNIYYKNMRIVAVDPNVIPLYSILKINVNGTSFYAIALDTGGDIKGNRIDVLVKTRKKAYQLGRDTAHVTILREGKGDNNSWVHQN